MEKYRLYNHPSSMEGVSVLQKSFFQINDPDFMNVMESIIHPHNFTHFYLISEVNLPSDSEQIS